MRLLQDFHSSANGDSPLQIRFLEADSRREKGTVFYRSGYRGQSRSVEVRFRRHRSSRVRLPQDFEPGANGDSPFQVRFLEADSWQEKGTVFFRSGYRGRSSSGEVRSRRLSSSRVRLPQDFEPGANGDSPFQVRFLEADSWQEKGTVFFRSGYRGRSCTEEAWFRRTDPSRTLRLNGRSCEAAEATCRSLGISARLRRSPGI